MESSPVDAHHDPRIWEQDVGLLEVFDIFISGKGVSAALVLRAICRGTDLEFAILMFGQRVLVGKRSGIVEVILCGDSYPPARAFRETTFDLRIVQDQISDYVLYTQNLSVR